MRLESGTQAPDFAATDHRGRRMRLSELAGPRWLAFFRYASCPLCNLRVGQLVARHEALAARGLQVVAVFQSPAESIARHAGALDPPFPLVADPTEELYRLYGLETSLLGLLSPSNLGPLSRAVASGLLPGRIEGSVTRIPGDFLVRADGTIGQAYYGHVIADHIPFSDVETFLAGQATCS